MRQRVLRLCAAVCFLAFAPWAALAIWGGCTKPTNKATVEKDSFTGKTVGRIGRVPVDTDSSLGPFPFLTFVVNGDACGVLVEVVQPESSYTNLQLGGLALKVDGAIIFDKTDTLGTSYDINRTGLHYEESLLIPVECGVLVALAKADTVEARVYSQKGHMTGIVSENGLGKLGGVLRDSGIANSPAKQAPKKEDKGEGGFDSDDDR